MPTFGIETMLEFSEGAERLRDVHVGTMAFGRDRMRWVPIVADAARPALLVDVALGGGRWAVLRFPLHEWLDASGWILETACHHQERILQAVPPDEQIDVRAELELEPGEYTFSWNQWQDRWRVIYPQGVDPHTLRQQIGLAARCSDGRWLLTERSLDAWALASDRIEILLREQLGDLEQLYKLRRIREALERLQGRA